MDCFAGFAWAFCDMVTVATPKIQLKFKLICPTGLSETMLYIEDSP